jgi:16S rRNA (guanine527-N7)-methyltransferase
MPTPAGPRLKLDDRQICDALASFDLSPSPDQLARIREYMSLLVRWNESISLTSLTEPIEIVSRHFGESIYASKLLPVENCRLADVGTGAGFPGLALKIASPSLRLMLIESNRKKCAFLSEVVRTLEFSDVDVRCERFEEIRPESISADIIAARAMGDFKRLLDWSQRALARRGHLVLWVGGEDEARISRLTGWIWQPAFHIPDSKRRYILIGRVDEITKR